MIWRKNSNWGKASIKNLFHKLIIISFVIDLKLDAREKAGTLNGFIGCMKDVELSRKVISIQSEHEPNIMKRKNLVECTQNPCSRMPCANGGSCEAFDQGYKCNCKPNFTGMYCQTFFHFILKTTWLQIVLHFRETMSESQRYMSPKPMSKSWPMCYG